MSKARLIITAVVIEGRPQADVAREYGVSKGWVSKLVARYHGEGDTAFEPRSRRPKTSPTAIGDDTVELIVSLRRTLTREGLDAGPDTIHWLLEHHHATTVSVSTIARTLTRGARHPRTEEATTVVLHPLRSRPTQRVLAVRLHPLPPRGRDRHRDPLLARRPLPLHAPDHRPPARDRPDRPQRVPRRGLRTWIPRVNVDRQRHGLHRTLRRRTRRTQRLRSRTGPTRHRPEELPTEPPHHLRESRTLPPDPQTLAQIPTRPRTPRRAPSPPRHVPRPLQRAAPSPVPPAARHAHHHLHPRPKATPTGRDNPHHRVRRDRIDTTGVVTLRVAGKLHHIGIGRTHARTHVILLVDNLHVRVVDAATGELLRELTIDTTRDYQPTGAPQGPTRPKRNAPNPIEGSKRFPSPER